MSLTVAGSGLMTTEVMDGAELPTVAVTLSAVPVSVPSSGVTVQVMASPFAGVPG